MKIKLANKKSKRYGDFEDVFLKELNKHAPLKKKFLRHNNNPFMTKNLRKLIMVRSNSEIIIIKIEIMRIGGNTSANAKPSGKM